MLINFCESVNVENRKIAQTVLESETKLLTYILTVCSWAHVVFLTVIESFWDNV